MLCMEDIPTSKLVKASVFVAAGAACLIYIQVFLFAKGKYKNLEFPEATKNLLCREHGSDADDVTDEAKVAYQLERRLLVKKAFWNLGSHKDDFMFFVANYHPVLAVFNHHTSHPISLFTRLLIELNALVLSISIQMEAHWCIMGMKIQENPIVKYAVSILIPMLTAEVLYQYIVCPCMAQSAKEKVTGCAGACKFKCAPLYRVCLCITLIWQCWSLSSLTPSVFLLGLGARCFGYLQFFPQTYIMQIVPLPGMGAWTKDNAKENASLSEALTKEKPDGLRGETCGQAVCCVIGCTVVLGIAFVAKLTAHAWAIKSAMQHGAPACSCAAP